MTLVAREPNTGRRAPPYNGTRDKETRVGLPPAVRDRSRLIVCLFDGRTKALRDKTSLSLSSSPPLLSFALSFLSKEGGRGERRKRRRRRRRGTVKVALVSSPPYGPPGAALKCLELFIARPREHLAV